MIMPTVKSKILLLGQGPLFEVHAFKPKMLDDAARRHIALAFIGLLACAAIIIYNCFR